MKEEMINGIQRRVCDLCIRSGGREEAGQDKLYLMGRQKNLGYRLSGTVLTP